MHFKYCPHCGDKLVDKEIGDEGMIPFCNPCKTPLWDMFTSCIICGVVNEYNEIALIKQGYVSDNYICVAGIIKLGENAEDTVVREVKEEINQEVTKVSFIKSYYYEKKQMLMLGFRADVKKNQFQLSCEVDDVKWFPLEEALSILKEGSIAWKLVDEIIANK